MKMILVPIEPLVERYSESWYRNLPRLFENRGFEVTVIDGVPLEQTVKVGTFLDINSTVHYKMTQMQCIAKLFHEGKVVGWITSGGYGYSVQKSIAYGYLPTALAKPGSTYETELFGERIRLKVEAEPLYDPKGERIKA